MTQALAAVTAIGAVYLGLRLGVWRWLVVLSAVPSVLVLLVPALADREPTWEWAAVALAVLAAARVGRARQAAALHNLGGVLVLAGIAGAALDLPLAVLWWPVAGAFGLTALLRGRRGRATLRLQEDDVDRAALAEFDARYETPALAPVAIVIAAYAEEHGLPGVLPVLPREVCGLATSVVVVDDGSPDRTAEVAEDAGVHVVRCGTNRGQGAALRLGYRVAREHGASYVITTDADGQYDVADMPAVLQPILDDRADFVTGSRRLGHQPVQDRLRRLGVYVFAGIVSLLTGRWLTDTSFGLRAMRAEVTAAVTLNQPQYQSSELLIGTISHGFRVLEVPGTMHARSAGTTKKGRNLVYGRRYAGVVLGTWWREGCPRPVGES
ncbi:glycosyltransferase family 2 protein [Nocardioides mangrovicus]|uniref:Glycosyltransferase family 2 protein n=1 Tax=Nocardioides mangrovicus TaxID=2478913 RepID=A0A3L8P050_9ACTN|nr:glycosyltransferase family 2 protein [Nocardioides mangrovicus]RLV48183.1 glycosyltransferase family 2 protein [Nocardioides mangrovicus]